MAYKKFIYLGTTPWTPEEKSPGELGERTLWPLAAGLKLTHRLYWRPRKFVGSCTFRVVGVTGLGCQLDGPDRVVEPIKLCNGGVNSSASGGASSPDSGFYHLSAAFAHFAESAFPIGEAVQYPKFTFTATLSSSGSGSETNNWTASTTGNGQQCGILTLDRKHKVPLFAQLATEGQLIVSASIDLVEWVY